MQLTLNLEFVPVSPMELPIQNHLWIDVSPEARMIGFTQKVEISLSVMPCILFKQKMTMPTTSDSMIRSGWHITTFAWINVHLFPSRSISYVKI